MNTKRYLSAVMALFALIFVISGSFSAEAAETEYTYRSEYMRNILETEDERMFYDELLARCEAVDSSDEYISSTEQVLVPHSVDTDRANELLKIFINDNPRFFWIDRKYTFSEKIERFRRNRYFDINVVEDFKDGTVRQSAKAKIMSAVTGYIDGAAAYDTLYDKALYFHNRLAKEIEYKDTKWDQTIASVFLKHQTVCAGYSKAFAMLCNAVGIEALVVTSDNHAWNIVRLGEDWFNVDVTNDYNSIQFFLVSDSDIANTDMLLTAEPQHIIDRATYVHYYDKFPKCPYSYSELYPDEEVHPLGDANSDGKVNVRDAAFIAKYLSQGKGSLLPEYADYDGDGKISVRDAAALARTLAIAA